MRKKWLQDLEQDKNGDKRLKTEDIGKIWMEENRGIGQGWQRAVDLAKNNNSNNNNNNNNNNREPKSW